MQPDRHLLMRVEHARVEELRLLDEQLATRRPTHVGIRLDLGEHVDAADKRQPDVLEEPVVRDEEEEEEEFAVEEAEEHRLITKKTN